MNFFYLTFVGLPMYIFLRLQHSTVAPPDSDMAEPAFISSVCLPVLAKVLNLMCCPGA